MRERFTDAALRLDGPRAAMLAEWSRDIAMVVGLVEEAPDARFFNSAVYFEGGEIRHVHRKIYLPTYGRFDERRWFGAGRRIQAFDTDIGRAAMLVCGDAWHLSVPYLAAHDGADLLIVPATSSNEGLTPSVPVRRAWEHLTTTLALTLSCYVLFVNRAGQEDELDFWGGSHVVLPDGNIAAQAAIGEPDLLFLDVDRTLLRHQRIVLPFRRDDLLGLTLEQGRRIQRRAADRRDAFIQPRSAPPPPAVEELDAPRPPGTPESPTPDAPPDAPPDHEETSDS